MCVCVRARVCTRACVCACRSLSGASLDLFRSGSDPLSLLQEKICGCTSSAFADLCAFSCDGRMRYTMCVCVFAL